MQSHALRSLAIGLFALAAASCGSTPTTSAQISANETEAMDVVESSDDMTVGDEVVSTGVEAPVEVTDVVTEEVDAVDPLAPAPWTGAYTSTAVMLSRTLRIEGPVGLLQHVVASSDDEFYERSVETVNGNLRQIITRSTEEVPEIRVQLDAWTIAVFERVVIIERRDDCPVRVVATGEAIWRDADGNLLSQDRLEFEGAIGVMDPLNPCGDKSSDEVPAPAGSEAVEVEPADADSAEAPSVDADVTETDPVDAGPAVDVQPEGSEPVDAQG